MSVANRVVKEHAIFTVKDLEGFQTSIWKNYVYEIRCHTPPRQVWEKMRAIFRKNDRKMIRTLKKSDGNLTTNRKKIAQLLADQFNATSHDLNYSADFIERKKRKELQTIIAELGQLEEYQLTFLRSKNAICAIDMQRFLARTARSSEGKE
jgi:hypothetical protein